MEQENILGKEKIGKLILKFSIPCIVSMLVNSLYNIVDQIFIGQGVGYLGNGATNVVFPLVMIGLAFFSNVWRWCISISKFKTWRKKEKRSRNRNWQWYTIINNCIDIFCIITLIFLPQFLKLFGCTDNLRDFAMKYGKIIAIDFPFL